MGHRAPAEKGLVRQPYIPHIKHHTRYHGPIDKPPLFG